MSKIFDHFKTKSLKIKLPEVAERVKITPQFAQEDVALLGQNRLLERALIMESLY